MIGRYVYMLNSMTSFWSIQILYFRFDYDVVVAYKKRILCDKKTLVDQFKNAYAIMNKRSRQMRIKKQQNLVNRTTQVISSHLRKSEKMSIHNYIWNERVLFKQKVLYTIQYYHARSPCCLLLSGKYSFFPFFTF